MSKVSRAIESVVKQEVERRSLIELRALIQDHADKAGEEMREKEIVVLNLPIGDGTDMRLAVGAKGYHTAVYLSYGYQETEIDQIDDRSKLQLALAAFTEAEDEKPQVSNQEA